MRLIDSHVHFWMPDVLDYGWLREIDTLNKAYLPHDYLLETTACDIEGVVFVQADCLPAQGIAEVKWVRSLGDLILGIVAFAPLEDAETTHAVLEELTSFPEVRGVRRLIQSEGDGFALQPSFVAGVQALERHNFSFDICVRHTQLADVIDLVKQCPNTQFVLDHAGKPDIQAGLLHPWRDQIRTLAGFENVMCKLSGLVTEADHSAWTMDDLRPYVDHLLETFGAERLLFGSDWPVMTLASPFQRWVDTVNRMLHALTDGEKQRIFADNARTVYRLDDKL